MPLSCYVRLCACAFVISTAYNAKQTIDKIWDRWYFSGALLVWFVDDANDHEGWCVRIKVFLMVHTDFSCGAYSTPQNYFHSLFICAYSFLFEYFVAICGLKCSKTMTKHICRSVHVSNSKFRSALCNVSRISNNRKKKLDKLLEVANAWFALGD